MLPLLDQVPSVAVEPSIAGPAMWWITIGAIIALFLLDFALTHKPHEVSTKEATIWTVIYIAIPVAFGGWLWWRFGSAQGFEFYTGYIVEKSLSVDNLFIFMLLLAGFAVPRVLRQRVLLIGVAGALILRGIFIALGDAMIRSFTWTFLFFGAILLVTAIKVFRDALSPADHAIEVSSLRMVRVVRRFFPVTDRYQNTAMLSRVDGKRALTPLALVTLAILGTDIIFAIDSVPAVYGITGDAYLVFVTNAFALLGLRALYFVLENVLSKLVHLGYGLAIILAFIGFKLILHWAHTSWSWLPEVPTWASLVFIVAVLVTVTLTSLASSKRICS